MAETAKQRKQREEQAARVAKRGKPKKSPIVVPPAMQRVIDSNKRRVYEPKPSVGVQYPVENNTPSPSGVVNPNTGLTPVQESAIVAGGGTVPTSPGGGNGRGVGPGADVDHPKRDDPAPAPAAPVDPNDKDGNGVPDAVDAQNKRNRDNAFEFLKAQFRQYGITDETFFQYIWQLLVDGFDANTISMLLQDHKVYKDRFKGNEQRRARGLGVLNPGEYIATEAAYAQVLRSLGLPPGFYDDPTTDFVDWIGKDISPQEIMERGQMAVEKVNQSDPSARKALRQFYGITDSQLAAYYLDDKRALPILRKQAAAAEIGGAAMRVGLGADRERAEKFADLGVTRDQAVGAYGEIADFLNPQQTLAQRHFEHYGLADAEDELLGGLASARRKRERINRKEEALFEGAGAVGAASFRQTRTGSY